MRKINSNGYAPRILGVGGTLAVMLPALLHALSSALSWPLLGSIAAGSMAIGGIILIAFVVLLAIELRQDRLIARRYERVRRGRIRIGPGAYECQACGNRMVKDSDSYCRLCGNSFTRND